MNLARKVILQKHLTAMNKVFLILLINLFPFLLFSQKRDTTYIIFDKQHKEMEKSNFTEGVQAGSPEENLEKSIMYLIQQMEKDTYGATQFKFSHFNQSKKAYQKFGGKPPLILKKSQKFLKGKKILDIEFFRTTPYIEVCKTFEEEDSWEQDVLIFMIDVDEIRNDSIVLREVTFTRPVKE